MEDFGWDGRVVTESAPLWSNDTLGQLYSSCSGPVPYDATDLIPNQMELQRAHASLIESSNSARLVQRNAHSGSSVAVAPISQLACPILSSCIMNRQSVGTKVAAGPAGIGLNAIDPSSKDLLDSMISVTNNSINGSMKEEAVASLAAATLQNIHSRSLWNFGSSGTISSGESENSNARMPDNKAKGMEGTNKRRHNVSDGRFGFISEVDPPKSKRTRSGKNRKQNNQDPNPSSNISFQLYPGSSSPTSSIEQEPDQEAITQMKEIIYRAAAFRPVNLGLEIVEKPKRKNMRISSDPQTVAARQRRERISERLRVLQRLVPGGNKMDTASMLDEAANYLKFLQSQIKELENLGPKLDSSSTNCHPIDNLIFSSLSFSNPFSSMQAHHPFPLQNPFQGNSQS